MKTHGETHSGRTPEYVAWISIKHRCYDKTYEGYERYGGRGIVVCDRWLHDYEAFLAYVGRRPSSKHQIDRWPNNDGNYEPGNVRWATPAQNCRHRSSAKLSTEQVRKIRETYATRKISQYVLAEEFGVSQSMINNILKRKQWTEGC